MYYIELAPIDEAKAHGIVPASYRSLSVSEIKKFLDMNCDYKVFALLIENEYSKEQAIMRSTPNDVKVVLNEPN